MSHNAYIRPGGVWLSNTPVLHTEFAAFDLSQFQSVNGDLGGSWAPASIITIGGAGLGLTGPAAFVNVTVSGTLGVAGAFSGSSGAFSGALSVDSITVANNLFALNVGASGEVNTAALVVGGATVLGGTLTVDGLASLQSTLDVQGQLTAHGPAQCLDKLSFASSGRVVKRVHSGAAAPGQTASVLVASVYYFTSTPAGSTIQIDTAGSDGDELEFCVADSTQFLVIYNPTGGGIAGLKNLTGSPYYARVMMISGTWTLLNSAITH